MPDLPTTSSAALPAALPATLPAALAAAAQALQPMLTATRRHLHAHPELSFQEHATMAYVSERLSALGVAHRTGAAGTGIIAYITGEKPVEAVAATAPSPALRTLALRADLDALPIQEVAGRAYGSTVPGVMHACGHDVHTTCLIGAAVLLQQHRTAFAGTVTLIFQPGEEKLPGGASLLLQEGALGNPLPQAIVGQHVLPALPVGKVGFRSGPYMASTDELELDITGRGGHGAMPHHTHDAVLAAAAVVLALQQVAARIGNPALPTALSIGRITAPGTYNVLPETVHLLGTFRTHNEAWREAAHGHIRRIAAAAAEAYGCTATVRINPGYPALVNDPALTATLRTLAEAYIGPQNIVDLDLYMTGEDFAYYSQVMPACFYRLGTGNAARGITAGVHTPDFDVDEACLPIGAGLMAWWALGLLGEG